MAFNKTLNIKRGDVKEKAFTLLLCFDAPDPKKLYHDQFPVAWRVIPYSGHGHEDTTITYKTSLFVATPQIVSGNVVKPTQWIDINPGQRTTLEKQGNFFLFTEPVAGTEDQIIADNKTGEPQDFTIGSVDDGTPVPLLVFTGIGHQFSLVTQFTPILKAYIISDYQETELLKGEIETKEPFWVQDLTDLNKITNWVLKKEQSGAYTLKQE